jgi:putative (di)nucleoside polyphosphate hydrolase
MPKDFSQLSYRPCVGIVLFNAQGLVWVGHRIPKWEKDGAGNLWQMPQGGIDEGESPHEAAFRELEEETGTRNAEIIGECPRWLTYDLPEEALGIGLKGKYRGQKQRWFAMRFLGSDDEFDIDAPAGAKAEFDAWDWVPLNEAAKRIVAFKRPIYEEVVKEFAKLAKG